MGLAPLMLGSLRLAPAAAAPITLSWNLVCAVFFFLHAQAAYPTSSTTTPASPARATGFSRNSSSRLGSDGGGAIFLGAALTAGEGAAGCDPAGAWAAGVDAGAGSGFSGACAGAAGWGASGPLAAGADAAAGAEGAAAGFAPDLFSSSASC